MRFGILKRIYKLNKVQVTRDISATFYIIYIYPLDLLYKKQPKTLWLSNVNVVYFNPLHNEKKIQLHPKR